MSDYIKREDAIDCIDPSDAYHTECLISLLPSADVVPIQEIYDAGYKGKEVRFRINGRLFAVRELAQ